MPPTCIVAGCSNTTKDGFSLHRFPSDPKFRRIWTAKVKLTRAKWSGPTEHSVICSAHFEPSCFDRNPNDQQHQFGIKFKAMLRPDAVPTIFLTSKKSEPVLEEKRKGAFAKRERLRVMEDVLPRKQARTESDQVGQVEDRTLCRESVPDPESFASSSSMIPVVSTVDAACQTDPVKILGCDMHTDAGIQAVPEVDEAGILLST
ncbi:THAP domain-containing protein 10-like [Acanthaster planci]|uniref:THAP domain-containing protein 10-like n=1 Tax=Acanthaster planci TaxID=133434 RepID=A0A8B7Z6N1_ACAPL|nr:THAP domain-containing protein 10-like [Acanthaster planci]